MKIEAGKWYKTRNGKKVYIIGRISDELVIKDYNYAGMDLNGLMLCWKENGNASYDESYLDLIEEWREPKKVKIDCWLNVYTDGLVKYFPNKSEANEYYLGGRIACIHIEREVTEGDGL